MNDQANTPGPALIRGYRPEALLLRLARRQLRDLQTHLPVLRSAKAAAYNAATRHLGLFADREFRLLARLAPVGLAIDIGGNWGQSVHALKRYARPARIVTIEPIPALARRLEAKFAGDSSVEVLDIALGPARGRQLLHIPKYRNYSYDGLASLDHGAAAGWLTPERMARFDPGLMQIESCEVAIEPLDSLSLSPDVIKIDVQGFEAQVLMGGIETIRRSQPVIIVERPSDAFVHILGKLGLKPYGWGGKHLISGDLTRKNTMFLSDRHYQLLHG
ncbi:FkbM family methyltransferase [Novosphingobium sp. MMS21-SN21R]|uniref:FkbM family methyltransferase n=1 Tax=Novosphingobium sp. MMS21-SN21R TaxID=2969298 RepID=UPI002885D026|nr:FkbM family methyltransferase [Novosphingobium sp. MMS21-SN21R]MDT0507840.1 FkbM family methyltransferase [Novosphingobium sp. MMS21-SN21R]